MINFTLWLTVCFGGKFRQKRTFASAFVSDADTRFRGEKSPTILWLVPFLFDEEKMAQQTPLYEQHTLCGARMVDFHGWMMPLHLPNGAIKKAYTMNSTGTIHGKSCRPALSNTVCTYRLWNHQTDFIMDSPAALFTAARIRFTATLLCARQDCQ